MTGLRPDGNCRACMVEIEGERIAGITGFAGYPELFPVFELPSELG
jgi:hypothetical protein